MKQFDSLRLAETPERLTNQLLGRHLWRGLQGCPDSLPGIDLLISEGQESKFGVPRRGSRLPFALGVEIFFISGYSIRWW